jgi:hypothetical protein
MLKRLFVVIQGEHFLVSFSVAAVAEVLLHGKPVSARNKESILLLEVSLPYFVEDS